MKWSLTVGKFWGTEIRLHATLLLLIPYVLVVFKPEDVSGAVRVLLLIAAIFACVGLHEVGHTVAARLFGIEVNSIVLWPLGGFANLARRPEKVWPDLIISAAGPAANLMIFAYLALMSAAEQILENAYALPALSHFLWSNHVFTFMLGLALANLSLAVFNLVPVYPLDGGQIARGLLKLIFGDQRADQILIIFSLPMALALTGYGFVSRDPIVILTGMLLVLAALTLNLRLTNGFMLLVLYFIDRGGYYLRRQDYNAAVREYTRMIERKPNLPGPYVSRAIAQMNCMNLLQARSDVDRALALDNQNPIAWTLRGELLALNKQKDAALSAFNQAIAIKPGWSLPYIDRAGLYQEAGDMQRALEDMNHGIELGQSAAVGYLLRSILRYQMGDLPGSRSDADQSLRFAPQWMLTFPEIFLENFRGHLDWAMDYYQRAIQRMPNAFQVYQGRADACRINERFDWAIADYQRAIERAPKAAELYLNRGITYQHIGALDSAADDFQTAASLTNRSHIRVMAESRLKQLAGTIPLPAGSTQTAPAEPGESAA